MPNNIMLAQSTSTTIPAGQAAGATTASVESSSGIQALGINGVALIFQIINFLILFLILKRFVFAPVLKMINERNRAIQKSLDDAKRIEDQKNDWAIEHKKMLDETMKKSSELLHEAKTNATKIKDDALQVSKNEHDRIIVGAQKEIETLKSKMMTEAKRELTDIVIQATKKVSQNTITSDIDQKMIDKSIREVL